MAEEESGKRFGALLREYRLGAGLTHEDVVDRSGVSLSTISRWERGVVRNPVPSELQAVCRAVGMSTVAAGIALGYLDPEDVDHLDRVPPPPPPPTPVDPRVEEAMAILSDPDMPEQVKESATHFLRFLHAQAGTQRPEANKPRAAS